MCRYNQNQALLHDRSGAFGIFGAKTQMLSTDREIKKQRMKSMDKRKMREGQA